MSICFVETATLKQYESLYLLEFYISMQRDV